MLKYKKRIRRFASSVHVYINRKGERISKPKTIDILKDNGQHLYKTTSTPCSCFLCQPYKYNRTQEKRSDIKEMNEDLELEREIYEEFLIAFFD